MERVRTLDDESNWPTYGDMQEGLTNWPRKATSRGFQVQRNNKKGSYDLVIRTELIEEEEGTKVIARFMFGKAWAIGLPFLTVTASINLMSVVLRPENGFTSPWANLIILAPVALGYIIGMAVFNNKYKKTLETLKKILNIDKE